MKKTYRILAALLSVILLIAGLTGCAERQPVQNNSASDGSKPGSVEGYLATGTLRYPIRTEDLRYTLYTNCAIITECVSDSPDIVIPAYIEGVPVIAIQDRSFSDRNKLQRIQIGANILSIGAYAFSGCSSLASVLMSGSVKNIGSGAFAGCVKLKNFIFPANVSLITSNVLSNCDSLTKVIIEPHAEETQGTVRIIDSGAFSGCGNLVAVWIPDEINQINSSIFSDRRTVIYGGESSAAAVYAANNRMDFVVTSRDDFDSSVRAYNPVGDTARMSSVGDIIEADHIYIRYDGVEYYSQLGTLKADLGEKIAKVSFTVINNAPYDMYFDGISPDCISWARDKDGVIRSYDKTPYWVGEKTTGTPFLCGTVAKNSSFTGAYVFRINEKSQCLTIQFNGTNKAFYIK